uniref:Transposon protein, putative, CACTA, En/Spm sub-class n=1 Tax=Oryza sativa subsp. japonica TaxID=39947 RepID=Q2QS44_ORYSJ|nr:transposon protein, putative, CACTA, En/Spm sub-class [Oryza sativa Japonica Group]
MNQSNCKNENMFDSGEDIHSHLIQRGFMEGYTCWVKHGEQESGSGAAADRSGAHNQEDEDEHDIFIPSPLGGEMVDVDHDLLQDMLRDVEDPAQNERDGMKFSRVVSDSETPLYVGCKAKHTKLSVTLDLMKLKASSGWTDKSFTYLLGILKAMLPVENTLPETTYEAKQVLCPLGLEVRRIHACPNDCILYHKQYADLDACPVCKASRYKRKKSADEGNKSKRGGPAKVVWYLPIIDRFKRIFANPNKAKLVQGNPTMISMYSWSLLSTIWRFFGKKKEGMLRLQGTYTKRTSNKAEKDARLEAKIRASIRAELTSKFDEKLESMRAKIRQEIRVEQQNPQAAAAAAHKELGSPTQKRSSCASTELVENPTSVDSAVDHITEPTSCTLTVRVMTTFTVPAAEGLAYKPTPETRVHGAQLRADYAKVQVDSLQYDTDFGEDQTEADSKAIHEPPPMKKNRKARLRSSKLPWSLCLRHLADQIASSNHPLPNVT